MTSTIHSSQTTEGSPDLAALFLDPEVVNGDAKVIIAVIQQVLDTASENFTPELVKTAEVACISIRPLDGLVIGPDKPDINGPPEPRRVWDARQILGYLGTACGFELPYIDTEAKKRRTLTAEELAAARLRSLAVDKANEADEANRQRSLDMAQKSTGDPSAAEILRRADPSRANGF